MDVLIILLIAAFKEFKLIYNLINYILFIHLWIVRCWLMFNLSWVKILIITITYIKVKSIIEFKNEPNGSGLIINHTHFISLINQKFGLILRSSYLIFYKAITYINELY